MAHTPMQYNMSNLQVLNPSHCPYCSSLAITTLCLTTLSLLFPDKPHEVENADELRVLSVKLGQATDASLTVMGVCVEPFAPSQNKTRHTIITKTHIIEGLCSSIIWFPPPLHTSLLIMMLQ